MEEEMTKKRAGDIFKARRLLARNGYTLRKERKLQLFSVDNNLGERVKIMNTDQDSHFTLEDVYDFLSVTIKRTKDMKYEHMEKLKEKERPPWNDTTIPFDFGGDAQG